MSRNFKPKGYYLQDGCWNCGNVNSSEVASDIYPVCNAYQKRFMCRSYGKCKRWKTRDLSVRELAIKLSNDKISPAEWSSGIDKIMEDIK